MNSVFAVIIVIIVIIIIIAPTSSLYSVYSLNDFASYFPEEIEDIKYEVPRFLLPP